METKLDAEQMKVLRNVEISIEIPPKLYRIENTAERDSRLRISEADAQHLRSKELLTYRLTTCIISIFVVLCSWIVLNKGFSNDEGKLALAMLISIVIGLVGFVAGKSSK